MIISEQMFSLGFTNVHVHTTHTHTHEGAPHIYLVCEHGCLCVCTSLVCHSEPCPYATKHKHVLFILERMRGGQQSLSKGWREEEKEAKKDGK